MIDWYGINDALQNAYSEGERFRCVKIKSQTVSGRKKLNVAGER